MADVSLTSGRAQSLLPCPNKSPGRERSTWERDHPGTIGQPSNNIVRLRHARARTHREVSGKTGSKDLFAGLRLPPCLVSFRSRLPPPAWNASRNLRFEEKKIESAKKPLYSVIHDDPDYSGLGSMEVSTLKPRGVSVTWFRIVKTRFTDILGFAWNFFLLKKKDYEDESDDRYIFRIQKIKIR